MLTGKKRHLDFVENMRNSLGKSEETTDTAENDDYDMLREELERKFDELFGPIDDEDDQ
jgi:hypothetical protein